MSPGDGADLQELVHCEDVPPSRLAPRDPVELAQLLEGVDPHVRIRADAQLDAAMKDALDGQEPVAEVRLRCRTRADAPPRGREQVELVTVRMRRMDDGCARSEAPARVEQLDRAKPVLREALLDFPRLLVGMDVQRQLVLGHVTAERFEPAARARPDGVGGDADANAVVTQLLQLTQVRSHRLLAKALDSTARVCHMKEDGRDTSLHCRRGCCSRLLEPEVVELPDRGVPGRTKLPIDIHIARPDVFRALAAGELEHRLPPRPEVAALRSPAQRPLERVAMRIYEPGNPRQVGHAREDTTLKGCKRPRPSRGRAA